MATHMARTDRGRRWAILLIALGIGFAVFALVDGDPGSDRALDSTVGPAASSSPTVLGAVVTAESLAPLAGPATPATFDVSASTTDRDPATRTSAAPRPTRPGPAATTTTTRPVTPPPTLGPAWYEERTTTTSTPPDDTTTTTSTPPDDTTTTTTSTPPDDTTTTVP